MRPFGGCFVEELVMNGMRLFQTCPVDNAELLAVMLGNHGIEAVEKMIEPMPEGEDEFSRPVEVYVPEGEYDRAFELFFGDNESEI